MKSLLEKTIIFTTCKTLWLIWYTVKSILRFGECHSIIKVSLLYECFKIDIDTWNYYHHVFNHLKVLVYSNCKTNFKRAHFDTSEVINSNSASHCWERSGPRKCWLSPGLPAAWSRPRGLWGRQAPPSGLCVWWWFSVSAAGKALNVVNVPFSLPQYFDIFIGC